MLVIPGTSKNLGYRQVVLEMGTPFILKDAQDFVPKSFDGLIPKFLVVQAEAGEVRWRDDGQLPTATEGMLILVNDTLQYNGQYQELIFFSQDKAILNFSFYAAG